MKLPSYIVQNIFYRLGLEAEQVKSSTVFVHKAKCPLCNDHAQRMYLREYGTFYNVKCHNCGYNSNFESFLKDNYPTEFEEIKPFIIESIKDGSIFKKQPQPKVAKKVEGANDLIDLKIKLYLKSHGFHINEVQEDNKKEELRNRIFNYVKNRKIPQDIYNDFYCILKGPMRGYIGIPFFDENKENIIHLQGRLFVNLGEGKHPKYIFLRDKIDGIELDSKQLWGLWRAKPSDEVILCEGTLDACAFRKGIATCGATIGESFIQNLQIKYPNRIWCIDSFWTDQAGRELTEKLLKMGERCFIIPKNLEGIKDANDFLCKFLKTEYIEDDVIKANTVSGSIGLSKLKLMEVCSIDLS